MLEIKFKNTRIEKVCTDASAARKQYGPEMADKIQQRIDEIRSAPNVEFMIRFRIGRCHLLQGDRKNQYAVDLVHPYRLVFKKKDSEIQIVTIIEIIDYH